MGIQQHDSQRFGRQLRFVARVLEVLPRLMEALDWRAVEELRITAS